MTKLTAKEESNCQYLLDEGYDYLSNSMREKYVRQHEVFEHLKHVDVDTFYGPAVSETVRNAMKQAIADGDRALVASLHSWCLAVEEPREVRAESKAAPLDSPIWLALLIFSVILVPFLLFFGALG